jgi:RAT1-interacting protein
MNLFEYLFKNKTFRFTFDFLSWRGTLRKIMSSLFDSSCDWRIGIIRWHGCYFMTVFHTETELKMENDQTPIEKRMQYWGHKFEDYITTDNPPLFPSPKKIFSTMNKATLGRHILLYSSEIDACTLNSTYDKDKKQGTYVEVKIAYAKHLLDLNTAS